MIIYIIEDSEDEIRDIQEFLTDEMSDFSDHKIKCFESCFHAFQAGGSPDIIIVDLAAIGQTSIHSMVSPIKNLMTKFTKSEIWVYSGIQGYACDAVNELKSDFPDRNIRFVGGLLSEQWDEALQSYVQQHFPKESEGGDD